MKKYLIIVLFFAFIIVYMGHYFLSRKENNGNDRFLLRQQQSSLILQESFDDILKISEKAANRSLALLNQEQKKLMTVQESSALDFLKIQLMAKSEIDVFHTMNITALAARYKKWNDCLPRITPYYAVKVNHDAVIVQVLSALGTGFDCASIQEIKQVLATGALPNRIIFAHTRKPTRAIIAATKLGVKKFTFDSLEELQKLVSYSPMGEYILRIKTHDVNSVNPLSGKFGASLIEAQKLIDYSAQHNINITGISFHVGSNNTDPAAYVDALSNTADLFDYAKNKYNKILSLVDMGGGFPGKLEKGSAGYDSFDKITSAINQYIASRFSNQVVFMAEPGRYMVTDMMIAASRIVGKSVFFDTDMKTGQQQKKFSYFLTDGVYGLQVASLYYQYDAQKLKEEGRDFTFFPGRPSDVEYASILWGPTCDAGDKIIENILLPALEVGDFIYSENMGAYTTVAASQFNQMTPSKAYYIMAKN